jgi:2-polyprenyl-3-methyl-5-hydroxy-6-metoxy-1,4-benzoquinol methylase
MTKLNLIDEESIFYNKFVDCFFKGAALQDIHVNSDHGYAAKKRTETLDPIFIKKRKIAAKNEFSRVFDHLKNLVDPVDKNFGFEGKSVLDFGCGTGALSVAMASRGAEVTGVDPTEVSLEACKYRAQYFQVENSVTPQLVSSTPELPFDDKSFDIVISNSVMEFIPFNRKEYIIELLRLVKASGLLIISTENGLFPFDYYTGQMFPIFRRKNEISNNRPYGITYFELLGWAKSSTRKVTDLSKKNIFNSFDKLEKRKMEEGRNVSASFVCGLNTLLKWSCRLISIPSDIFLPYTTFILRVDE